MTEEQLPFDMELPTPVIDREEIARRASYTKINLERRDHLVRTLDLLKNSRSTRGAHVIGEGNKDYERLEHRSEGGVEGVAIRSIKREKNAKVQLELACGKCAVEDCVLRDNWDLFTDKYHGRLTDDKGRITQHGRSNKQLRKALSKDPTAPC